MIVSIYLKEHEYLNTCGQTFNFGGKYIYSFEEHGEKILVKRTLNEKHISDFFNISESSCKVNLLSAIVGENGVGKSSVLDIIRNTFSNPNYSGDFADNSSIILVEENGETKILYSNITAEILLLQEEEEIILGRADRKHYQSIYYSPHFDLKYHPNFDEIDPYDISLDKYIQKDLENIDEKGTNESGWKYPPHEELKFKESMRQIELMLSSIFQNNSVFREIFNLPEYKKGILYFRDRKLDYGDKGKVEFWNTPMPLQSIIQLILDKIEIERKDWHIFRDNNLHLDDNTRQALVNKYLLEKYVIQCFMTTIINQMEKHNTWLTEAKMTEPYQEERFKNDSAKDVFLYFIKESFIEIGGHKKKIFEYEKIKLFIEKLYTLFEKEKNPDKITKQSIWLDLSELEEILELHHKIITNLFHYYPKDEDKIDKMNYVEGFLSYRPTDRNMRAPTPIHYRKLIHNLKNSPHKEKFANYIKVGKESLVKIFRQKKHIIDNIIPAIEDLVFSFKYFNDFKPQFKKEDIEKLLRISFYKKVELLALEAIKETVSKINQEYFGKLLHNIREDKSYFQPIINPNDVNSVLAVKPKLNNPRIIRQQGAFLIFGIDNNTLFFETKPMAKLNEDWILRGEKQNNPNSERIIINKSKKKRILDELDELGINQATLFPEIDKVGAYIKEKFEK